jgi:tetratricopeptide (TPR) repeat protein
LQEAESIPLLRETYEIIRQSDGPDHAKAQTALSLEATAHLNLGDYEQALVIVEKCHASRERTMPKHWLRFYAMSLLGEAHLGLGHLDQAEPLLVEGYSQMREQKSIIPVRAHGLLHRVQGQLIKLYESKDMLEEADKYRNDAQY